MKTEEKAPNKKRLFKILIILALIICVIILVQFAWAKYIAQLNGNAYADIACFNFNVKAGSSEELVVDLGKTRGGVKQAANVQEDYIGPGTAGKFDIVINATDSETSLMYEINMDIDYQNNNIFPKNLIFYYDEEMKNAIFHSDNKISINGYIPYSESNKVQTKTVYWKWDYETGQTQDEKDTNDIADSYWMGKIITLSINVVGRQVSTNPTINQCAVTFDANGGIMQEYGNAETVIKNLVYNERYGELPIPTRDGYRFEGWYVRGIDIAMNIQSGESRFYYRQIVDNVFPGTSYNITMDSATIKRGDANKFSLLIHDWADGDTVVGTYNEIEFSDNSINISIVCPQNISTSHKLGMLLYGGIVGKTNGNYVEYKNVVVSTNNLDVTNPVTENSFASVVSPHTIVAKWEKIQ